MKTGREKRKNTIKQKKKKGETAAREEKLILAFPVIVSIVIIILAARNIYQRNPSLFRPTGKEAVKEQGEEARSDLTDLKYEIPEKITYPKGSTNPGSFQIKNPSDNPYTIQVILTQKATQEELYRSPKLKPGEKVSGIPLKKELPKGTKAGTAVILASDSMTGKELGQVSLEVTIEVP